MTEGHGRQSRNFRQDTYREREYQYGSTARDMEVKRSLEGRPGPRLSNETRKNREKAHYMNFGYVLFLMAALIVSGVVLINYIQLQAEVRSNVKKIAAMESTLNSMQQENDETYSRLMSSVDLEEIKRIAIGELGMTYASEDQVITYSNERSDYVRQYSDIPR